MPINRAQVVRCGVLVRTQYRRMATSQQIETVAQAIRQAWGARNPLRKPRAWDALPEQVREDFRREARAAIAAYESTL